MSNNLKNCTFRENFSQENFYHNYDIIFNILNENFIYKEIYNTT